MIALKPIPTEEWEKHSGWYYCNAGNITGAIKLNRGIIVGGAPWFKSYIGQDIFKFIKVSGWVVSKLEEFDGTKNS